MLYRLLSSLKTSVYILCVMCLVFLVGTIFPQGENIDDYIKAGGKYVALVRAMDFLDIFMSPLFLVLTFILILNLAVCLFDRFRIFLTIRRKPMEFDSLKNHARVVTLKKTDFEKRLKKIGFIFKTEAESDEKPRVKIFEKGISYRWLSWFYHVGIILAICGFFLTALFAFEEYVLLYPDKPETISIYSRETLWNSLLEKMGIGPRYSKKGDEYVLKLGEFSTEYYQGLKIDYPKGKMERFALGVGLKKIEPSSKGFSYMPKMWRTNLEIKRPDGVILDAELWVNRPYRTQGLTLYQMGYEQKILLVVNGEKIEVEARMPFEVKGVEGKFALGSLKVGTLYKKDGTTEEITPLTTVYFLPEGKSSDREELGELKLGAALEAKGLSFEFKDYKEGSYLSYRKDPGVWLVGLACLFVFLGLFVRNLGAWYRIQCAVDDKKAYAVISTRGILADRDRIIRKLTE